MVELLKDLQVFKSWLSTNSKSFYTTAEFYEGMQYITIYYTGFFNEKEVIFESNIQTLIYVFDECLSDLAKKQSLKKYPDYLTFNNVDLTQDLDLDTLIELTYSPGYALELKKREQILKKGKLHVQEFITYEPVTEHYVKQKVALNASSIDEKGINSFIKLLNDDNFNPNPKKFSFSEHQIKEMRNSEFSFHFKEYKRKNKNV